jgi:uncharacterized protein YjbJ (UPF0337 family)
MTAQDKMRNKAQTVKGRVKAATGRASDNHSLEVKGKAEQVAGNLKQVGEKVKDSVRAAKR